MMKNDHEIRIIFIRHGFSCANAVSLSPAWFAKWRFKPKNPPLTDLATDQIRAAKGAVSETREKLGPLLRKCHHVFSSDMLRTQETALQLFPSSQNIAILPYVNEIPKSTVAYQLGFDPENESESLEDTRDHLRMLKYDVNRLDTSMYEALTLGELPDGNVRTFFHDIVLERWLNPASPWYLFRHRSASSRRFVTVAVVTHSEFMKHVVAACANARTFWSQKPRFSPAGPCRHYKAHRDLSNLAMIGLTELNAATLHRYLTGQGTLPPVERLYDPTHIPVHDTCVDLRTADGDPTWLRRCPPLVRNMPLRGARK